MKGGGNINRCRLPRMHLCTCSAFRSILTPSFSSTSALPHWLLAARLPCLATFIPAPAATKAAAVEILKVLSAVSSGPHDIQHRPIDVTRMAFARMTPASPAISSDGLSLYPQGSDKSAELGRSSLPFHYLFHDRGGFVCSQRSVPDTSVPIASLIMSSCSRSRKFFNISFPPCVINDSGWNWTLLPGIGGAQPILSRHPSRQ